MAKRPSIFKGKTKLQIYLMFWECLNRSRREEPDTEEFPHFDVSQYIFKKVQKHTPKFTMRHALLEYNDEMYRRYEALNKTDQMTVMIMDKMPESAQYPVKKDDATT